MQKKTVTPRKRMSLTKFFPGHSEPDYSVSLARTRETHIAEVSRHYRSGRLSLVVGAGLGMSYGLPSWSKLIEQLTVGVWQGKMQKRFKLANVRETYSTYRDYWRITGRIGSAYREVQPILGQTRFIKHSLRAKLAQAVALQVYGPILHMSPLKNVFTGKLKLELSQIREHMPESSRLLDSLLTMITGPTNGGARVRTIINYNYDNILELKLRDSGLNFETISSNPSRQKRPIYASYHVHGLLDYEEFFRTGLFNLDATGNFVFSEDDYHAQYRLEKHWANKVQLTTFSETRVLFVGTSLVDPNIRRLLEAARLLSPKRTHYAILSRVLSPVAKTVCCSHKCELRKSKKFAQILSNLQNDNLAGSLRTLGVKVIWVDDYSEIPAIIDQIAKA